MIQQNKSDFPELHEKEDIKLKEKTDACIHKKKKRKRLSATDLDTVNSRCNRSL